MDFPWLVSGFASSTHASPDGVRVIATGVLVAVGLGLLVGVTVGTSEPENGVGV
jgi:hypothetical protein